MSVPRQSANKQPQQIPQSADGKHNFDVLRFNFYVFSFFFFFLAFANVALVVAIILFFRSFVRSFLR